MLSRLLLAVVFTLLFQTARLTEPIPPIGSWTVIEPKESPVSVLGGFNSHLSPGSKCTIDKDGHDPCGEPYYCIKGVCTHKNILPDLTHTEIFGSILVIIIIGFANAGGVGGSSFVIPVFILIFGYSANEAVRVVYSVVFGGLLSGVALKALLREPKYKRPVIIYDIVAICAPLLVLGAKFGTLANSIIPEVATVCLVWVVSVVVLKSMWENIKKSLQKDREARARSAQENSRELKNSLLKDGNDSKIEANDINESSTVQYSAISPQVKRFGASPTSESDRDTPITKITNSHYQQLLKKETRLFPWEIYLQFVSYLLLSFLLQLVNGSKGVSSIVGIEYCSVDYWLVYCSNIILCSIFWSIGVLIVKRNDKARENSDMDLSDEYRVSLTNIRKLSAISLGVGFLGGVIGLGGALLFVPLLLSFGIPPIRATATASFMAIFTSSTSVFVTLLSKRVTVEDTLYLGGIAFLGATVIANPIVYLTQKYKRTTLLTIILFCLLFIDLLYYPTYEIWRLIVAREETLSITALC